MNAEPCPSPPCNLPRPLAVALVALVLLAALLPTLLVAIPALTDYPNHLARMSILVRDGTPAASAHYQVTWALYPNLAMDIVVPRLARWLDVVTATKLFYLAAQLLVLTGAMAVGHAAQRRIVLPALIAALYLYAPPFAWGFVNFEFGLGVALWGFAIWVWLAGRVLLLRLAVHALFVVALFYAHLLALGLYGLMAGAFEMWRLWQARAAPAYWALVFAGMALPVGILLGLMKASGGTVGGAGNEWFFANKLTIALEINGFSRPVSLVLSVLLAVVLGLAFRRGLLRLVGAGPWLAAILLGAFVLMPSRLLDTAFVDGRVLVALALALPAFIQVSPGRPADMVLGALALLALAGSAFTALSQWHYASDYRAMLAALETLPARPRILIARTGPEDDPPDERLDYPMFHAAMLGVHTRDALVPTLFAYPGKQPVRPRPEVAALTIPQGGPVPLDILTAIARGGQNPTSYAFLTDWPEKFGYLVLLKPQGNPLPERLELLTSERRFALFRVRPR